MHEGRLTTLDLRAMNDRARSTEYLSHDVYKLTEEVERLWRENGRLHRAFEMATGSALRTCERCNGTGALHAITDEGLGSKVCPPCRGTGGVWDEPEQRTA